MRQRYLDNVRVEACDDELDKVLPVRQPALEEPHDDDVVGERDRVCVELVGVREREGDGEHGHVVRVGEAGENVYVEEVGKNPAIAQIAEKVVLCESYQEVG